MPLDKLAKTNSQWPKAADDADKVANGNGNGNGYMDDATATFLFSSLAKLVETATTWQPVVNSWPKVYDWLLARSHERDIFVVCSLIE